MLLDEHECDFCFESILSFRDEILFKIETGWKCISFKSFFPIFTYEKEEKSPPILSSSYFTFLLFFNPFPGFKSLFQVKFLSHSLTETLNHTCRLQLLGLFILYLFLLSQSNSQLIITSHSKFSTCLFTNSHKSLSLFPFLGEENLNKKSRLKG